MTPLLICPYFNVVAPTGQFVPFDQLYPHLYNNAVTSSTTDPTTGSTTAPALATSLHTTSTNESLPITSTWIKHGAVRLPKKLVATFSGIEIDKKDVGREAGQRGFLKHYRDQLLKNANGECVCVVLSFICFWCAKVKINRNIPRSDLRYGGDNALPVSLLKCSGSQFCVFDD